jgi:hypothetical protein
MVEPGIVASMLSRSSRAGRAEGEGLSAQVGAFQNEPGCLQRNRVSAPAQSHAADPSWVLAQTSGDGLAQLLV